MTTQSIINLIKTTQPAMGEKGRLFTITFRKKNGTLRTMRCRLGLQRNLKGKGLNWKPEDKGMMVVWSADSQGYRNININTITELMMPDGRKHLKEVAI